MLLHKEITDKILQAFYKVYNVLGYGFLEKVYENALAIELRESGIQVACQVPITVYYKGHAVGDYFADLLVENKVIVELKAASNFTDAHEAQLLNYLYATDYEVGLLLNFGPEPKFARKVYENHRKQYRK